MYPKLSFIIVILSIVILTIVACDNGSEPPQVSIPVLTTSEVIGISSTSASSGGNITSDSGAAITTRGVCWSTNQNPIITDSKTTNGSGTGNFTSNLTGLVANTVYNVRAYAINSVGTGYGNAISFTTLITTDSENTVTDIDGNVYRTVKIGNQVWMAENLKTTKYRNGNPIPNVTVDATWFNLTTGAYCNYDNDSNIASIYGKLYNWYAVNDSRNIAPIGWHVPSHNEWLVLENYLGGANIAGGKLKEAGISHWQSPNTGATNHVGFTAFPGGYRNPDGPFRHLGDIGFWWTSTLSDMNKALRLTLRYFDCTMDWNQYYLMGGMSVRCIKD